MEFIPNDLDANTLYISIDYTTVIHLCCCGCGEQVVTPLSPTDWSLIYDGESISLYPSIGNWSFACQSHYWIRQSEVVWARRWEWKKVQACRDIARSNKLEYAHTKKQGLKYDNNDWLELFEVDDE